MLIARNGDTPRVHPSARVALTAQIVGNVTIGPRCFVDYGAVIASGGPPIQLDEGVIVLANAVIRSVGGTHRPPFPVRIGADTLISPACVLTGCDIGARCYIATGVLIFQGARIGDSSRVAAGAIVHLRTALPPGTRVGLRHIAAPTADGFMVTPDIAEARAHIAAADFFATVFGEGEEGRTAADGDQDALHCDVMGTLAREVFAWTDEPVDGPAGADDDRR